jgi:hypothetical protein
MKKYFYKSLMLLFAAATLSSCLKDDSLVLDPEKGHNVIEFGNTSEIAVHGSSIPLFVHSYELGPDATLPLVVSYSGPEATAPQDITVTLQVMDQATIDIYNEEQHTAYELMPAEAYSLPGLTVVIPKGQSKGFVNLTVKPNSFDLSKEYVLPLKITSVSSGVISGNFGTALYAIGAKNPYDGVYTYKTSANTSLVPNANKVVSLVTKGANTVKLNPGLLGTYSNEVSYTIDPVTNAVTVACPSLGVQQPQDTRSKWNPETKTLTVFWKQGNGGRTFEETFTFRNAR